MLAPVDDAASKITGTRKGTTRGLVVLLAQLKASARDLQQEERFSDHAGSQRAFNAIVKLYRSSAQQRAAARSRSRRRTRPAQVRSGGRWTRSARRSRAALQPARRFTVTLQHVVDAVIATVERRSPGTTSGPSPRFTG